MSNDAIISNHDLHIRNFAALIQKGVNAWADAGALLLKIKSEDPDILLKITDAFPNISMRLLELFLRIGQKKIYPYLLIDPSPGAQRLLSLPYLDQERIYKEGVEVLRVKNGLFSTELVRIQKLDPFNLDRVFDSNNNRIRSIDEQKSLTEYEVVISKRDKPTLPKTMNLGYFRIEISSNGDPVLKKVDKQNPKKEKTRRCYLGDVYEVKKSITVNSVISVISLLKSSEAISEELVNLKASPSAPPVGHSTSSDPLSTAS